jgi:phosphatidylglycerol---prolipoprotein diacylglyceryl transferase
MQFPVYFYLLGHRVHPHPVMEGLGYVVGLSAMVVSRKRGRELETQRSVTEMLWLTAAAAMGALAGAKLLAWVEGPAAPTMDNFLTGGKTIVGGLAGAWLATEVAKKVLGITRRTGDAWVIPLCAAIAVGRVGCFLTGLSDNTYGVHSALPWAVDFGDGPRHPTQLYESGFALVMLIGFLAIRKVRLRAGVRFRMFMVAYMGFRFLVEFLKPSHKPILGMSCIQVVALVVAGCAGVTIRGRGRLVRA